jgi:hypothetical protein
MRQFSLATIESTRRTAAPSRRWLLVDIAMTVIMLGLTSVFVGTLAMSMS